MDVADPSKIASSNMLDVRSERICIVPFLLKIRKHGVDHFASEGGDTAFGVIK
jgi:hypothetical protein